MNAAIDHKILDAFGIAREGATITPLGIGLINNSFIVRIDETPQFVLQRMNSTVFQDVPGLMNNAVAITQHLRRLNPDPRRSLEFLPAKAAPNYFHYDGQFYWRVSKYIPGACSRDVITPELAQSAGRAFASFQQSLKALSEPLVETIPHFHDLGFRYQQLEAVRARASGNVRAEACLRAVDERRAELSTIPRVPRRVCHADTKVNNILFDEQTGEALCIVDLDTVMLDHAFADFGDFCRTACNPAGEDAFSFDVKFDIPIFEAFTRGFLSIGHLSSAEVRSLVFGIRHFALMQAVRFLHDFLQGSKYYRVSFPDQNLQRAEVQLKLLEIIEGLEPQLTQFVDATWTAIQKAAPVESA